MKEDFFVYSKQYSFFTNDDEPNCILEDSIKGGYKNIYTEKKDKDGDKDEDKDGDKDNLLDGDKDEDNLLDDKLDDKLIDKLNIFDLDIF